MQIVSSFHALRTIGKVAATIATIVFAHSTYALTSDEVWGDPVSFSGNRIGYSSPAIGEVDGDTSDGKEIVAASIDGIVAAFKADGSLLWEVPTPDSGCGGRSQLHSSPAIGNLNGDGIPYVVIGYGGFSKNCEGGIMVIRGTDGSIAWTFSTKAFTKKRKIWAVLHAVYSSPGLSDTDGDGKMEIGFSSFDRYVYLLNSDGSIRWVYTAADTSWSSPTFADLNGDGIKEMIIGTDISGNTRIKPITKNGGNLYAFRTQKNPKVVYGFRDKNAFLWMKPVEQTLMSSPRVGEVIPASPGLEVVINSGCYFPERTNQKVGRWSRVFSGKTGKILRTLPLEACSSSSPALTDINGDGALDVVVTVNGSGSVGGDGSSHLEAFDANNNVQLWNTIPLLKGQNYAYGGNYISPVIRDVDANGIPDIITSVATGVGIYRGDTGAALSCEESPCNGAPLMATRDVLLNTPAVDDIDGDGKLDIIAAGKGANSSSAVHRWELN